MDVEVFSPSLNVWINDYCPSRGFVGFQGQGLSTGRVEAAAERDKNNKGYLRKSRIAKQRILFQGH